MSDDLGLNSIVWKTLPNSYIAAKQSYLTKQEANQINGFAWYANLHRTLVNMDPDKAQQSFSALEKEHQEYLKNAFGVDYGAKVNVKQGWAPYEIFTNPIGSLFKGAYAYSNLLSASFRFADAKMRNTGMSWDEIYNGEAYFNEEAARPIDDYYGTGVAKIARLAATGKTPGDIMLELKTPEEFALFERFISGDEVFDKAIAEYNDAKVSPGRAFARGIGSLFGIRPEAGEHGIKRWLYDRGSGLIDVTFQIIADPLTWVTGGVGTGIKFAGLGVTKGTRNLLDLVSSEAGPVTKKITVNGEVKEVVLSDPSRVEKMFAKKGVQDIWNQVGPLIKRWDEGDTKAFNEFYDLYGNIARPLGNVLRANKVYDADSAKEFFSYADNVHSILSGKERVKVAAMPVWNFRRKVGVKFRRTILDTIHGKAPETTRFKKGGGFSKDEVFVFGSNLQGIHGAGAAKVAAERHGAEYGVGVGRTGNSYAIPTKASPRESLPLETIQGYVNDFLDYARKNQNTRFNLTAIGTKLAGYKPSEIAPMFTSVPDNVVMPLIFTTSGAKYADTAVTETEALERILKLGDDALTADDVLKVGPDFVYKLKEQEKINERFLRFTARFPMGRVIYTSDKNVNKTAEVYFEMARIIYPKFWARALQGEFLKANPDDRLRMLKGTLIQVGVRMGIANDINGAAFLLQELKKYDGVYSVETPFTTELLSGMRGPGKTNKLVDINSPIIIDSGGAIGADTAWAKSGARYGFQTIAHTFPEAKTVGGERLEHLDLFLNDPDIIKIAKRMGRAYPPVFKNLDESQKNYSLNLIRRNFEQVRNAEAVVAVGRISKDWTNPLRAVEGGTQWAVAFGIESKKPVYVFDQRSEQWYTYTGGTWKYISLDDIPVFTRFAGVGSREGISGKGSEFTEQGLKAIDSYVDKIAFSRMQRTGTVDPNAPIMVRPEINSFRGEYAFLSNFYNSPVTIDGITYQNAEAAFQAAKSTDDATKLQFSRMSGKEAQKAGNRIQLRPDWNEIRIQEMRKILGAKFTQNPELLKKLKETEDYELIEGNDWGDVFWGVSKGEGENQLGKLLMEIRDANLPPRTVNEAATSLPLRTLIDNIGAQLADEIDATKGVYKPGTLPVDEISTIRAQTAVHRKDVSDMQGLPDFAEWIRQSKIQNDQRLRAIAGRNMDEINNNWSFLTLAPRLGIRSAIDELLFYGLDASIKEILAMPIGRAASRALRKSSTGTQDLTITRKIGYLLTARKKGYSDERIAEIINRAAKENDPRIFTSWVAKQTIREIPFYRFFKTIGIFPKQKDIENWMDELIRSGRMADFGKYIQTGMTAGVTVKSGSQLGDNTSIKSIDSASAVTARLKYDYEADVQTKTGLVRTEGPPTRISRNEVSEDEFTAAWFGSIVRIVQFDPIAARIIFKNINNPNQAAEELYRYYLRPQSQGVREQFEMMISFNGTRESLVRKAFDEFSVFRSFFVDSDGRVIQELVDAIYRTPPKVAKALKKKNLPINEDTKRVTNFMDNDDFGFDDLRTIYKNSGYRAPVAVHGYNQVSVAAKDTVGGFLLHLRDAGFGYMDRQLGMMAREPMYLSRYFANRQELKGAEIAYTRSLMSSMEQDARKNVLESYGFKSSDLKNLSADVKKVMDVSLRDELENAKKHANMLASEKFTHIAAENARERTLQYIDNPMVRSHFAFHSRNFARFYRATEDFYRRAGRLGKNNPQALIRLRLALIGIEASGFIHEDENGESYFVYPGDEIIYAAVNGATTLFGGQPALDVVPVRFGSKINMIAPSLDPDSALPSFSGPFSAIPISIIRKLLGSSLADPIPGEFKAKFDRYSMGAYAEFSTFWETVLPTSVKRIYSTLNRNEQNKQVASALMAAAVYEAGAGRGPSDVDTWAELQEKKTALLATAVNVMTVRNMLGMFAPAGLQTFEIKDIPNYILETDTTRLSGEFYKVVDGRVAAGSADPWGEAIAIWTRTNPGRLVYTVPRTENEGLVKVQKTKEAANWIRENQGFMSKYSQTGALFAPQIGEFDINAYNYIKLQGFTGTRELDAFLEDLYTEQVLRQDKERVKYWSSMIAGTSDPDTKKYYRQLSEEEGQKIKDGNPLLAQRLARVRYSTYEQQNAMEELRSMIAAGDAPDPGRAVILQQMINIVDSAMFTIDEQNGGYLLSPEKVANVRQDAILQLERIAGSDRNLQLAINRVFEPILEKARNVVNR